MSTKLSPSDRELYNRVDEVLHYIWDPIGVSGVPAARDEYHGYLPQVFSMVKQGKSVEEIAKHLENIETQTMGLTATDESILNDKDVASILLDHKEWLDEKAM